MAKMTRVTRTADVESFSEEREGVRTGLQIFEEPARGSETGQNTEQSRPRRLHCRLQRRAGDPIGSLAPTYRERVSIRLLLDKYAYRMQRECAEAYACDDNGCAGTLFLSQAPVCRTKKSKHDRDSQAKKPSSSSRRVGAGSGAPGASLLLVVGSLT